jgi:hypothetical protein
LRPTGCDDYVPKLFSQRHGCAKPSIDCCSACSAKLWTSSQANSLFFLDGSAAGGAFTSSTLALRYLEDVHQRLRGDALQTVEPGCSSRSTIERAEKHGTELIDLKELSGWPKQLLF